MAHLNTFLPHDGAQRLAQASVLGRQLPWQRCCAFAQVRLQLHLEPYFQHIQGPHSKASHAACDGASAGVDPRTMFARFPVAAHGGQQMALGGLLLGSQQPA